MFRRITAVFIALGFSLCLLSVSGCGSSGGTSENTPAEPAESTASSSDPGGETHTIAGSGKDGSEETGSEKEGSGETVSETDPVNQDKPDREAFTSDPDRFPITVADNDQLLFVIERCSYDPLQGYSWTVSIENRTGNALLFALDKVSHDDVMCDPYWAETVAVGKKAVSTVSWLPYSLEEADLCDVTKTECILTVYNDDDYTAPMILKAPFTVYPRGEEAASSQIRPSAETDVVLVETESCRVTMTGADAEGDWGYTLKLYLENLSDEDLIFSAENVSVNGIMADPYWAASVAAGKRSASSIIWSRNTLEEKGIGEVDEIDLPLLVYSEENYGDIAAEETVTLTP